MRTDPADVEKLARLAESRGGKALAMAPPEAEAPAQAPGRHEFTVTGWRPATINELTKRGNHFFASRLKKLDRDLVAAYSGHVPRAIRKRRVSVHVTMAGRMRPVDPDAIWKSTCDALVAAGLLVDDSPSWLELGPFTQARGVEKSTRIILEDLPS